MIIYAMTNKRMLLLEILFVINAKYYHPRVGAKSGIICLPFSTLSRDLDKKRDISSDQWTDFLSIYDEVQLREICWKPQPVRIISGRLRT